jgi:hypothetical protein
MRREVADYAIGATIGANLAQGIGRGPIRALVSAGSG